MVGGCRRTLVFGVAFVLLYQMFAALVVLSQPEAAATFWYPPIGIGMLGVLFFGPLGSVLVFVCDLAVMRLQFGLSPVFSTIIAATTTLECLVFYAVHRRIASRLPITDLPAYLMHFAAVLGAAGAGALVGSVALLLYRGVGENPFVLQLATWWIADFSGAIAVVSVGLFVLRTPTMPADGRRDRPAAEHASGRAGPWWHRPDFAETGLTRANAAAYFGMLAGISVLVYLAFVDTQLLPGMEAQATTADRVNFGFGFLLILPIVWIARHYRASLVALTMLYVSASVAITLALGSANTFNLARVSQFGVFNVQAMLAAINLLGISVAIVMRSERRARDAERRALATAQELHHERAAALEEGEELAKRLHETIETIQDTFFILDRDGVFIFANRQTKGAGLVGSDFIGKNLFEVFPYFVGTEIERNFHKALHTREPVSFVTPFGLSRRWFSIRVHPVNEGLAVYSQEVTGQVRQQEQLQLMQTAVEHMTDMVQIATAGPGDLKEQRVIYVNEAFVRKTGYSREEIIGMSPFTIYSRDPSAPELARVRAALENDKLLQGEFVAKTRSGEEFLRDVSVIPIHNSEGECTHFVSVSRDVTERRRIEEHMRQSQKLEAVGKLTGGVAHDFNNLLAVIIGNAEMLAEDLDPASPLRGRVETIQKAADGGVEMIRYLLAFSRRQALEPKIVDVRRRVEAWPTC
ncbi:PAS domain-containing protein [Breoghania sp. L-A4]|uniref:PAS domain-containing protein n=1 Tax=Breoghania sp. L-A4 TaxID=2304600 RepID=UPI000E35802B|nr:PAS domain-containing protein [Breoghania sp. L-A4]AXS40370.1 PAS domain S-box protein [Breoghania sp. L-A4]